MVLSKGSMAMFADVPDQLNVEAVRDRFLDDTYDLIIAEGWNTNTIRRSSSSASRSVKFLCRRKGFSVISDKPVDLAVPLFGLDDVVGVAALIMKQFPRSLSCTEQGMET